MYNIDLKNKYINLLIEMNKISYRLYNKLFMLSSFMENDLNKDLSAFNRDELLELFTKLGEDKNSTTIINYNFLLKAYKQYCVKENVENANSDVLETKQIKTIECDNNYIILNDKDVDNLTMNTPIDGTEHNVIIFLRLLWEIDAREKPIDILKLKIWDVKDYTVTINNHTYPISNYLYALIKEFANESKILVKRDKQEWERKILTAEQNDGLIFRKTLTSCTRTGEPMSVNAMDNIINKWCLKWLDNVITIKDFTMSLALKYMLVNKKTHTEMFTESRYFQKLLSFVYRDVFNKNAKKKFPELYRQYVNYFVELKNKYKHFV
jgi:hypothetical protein